jgi:hypothetical protein
MKGGAPGRRYERVMEAAFETTDPARGAGLLLAHCAAIERLDDARPPAFERLQGVLGGDLARFLVGALAGDHRGRTPDLVT